LPPSVNEIRWICKLCRAVTPQAILVEHPDPEDPRWHWVRLRCAICNNEIDQKIHRPTDITPPPPEPKEEPKKKKFR